MCPEFMGIARYNMQPGTRLYSALQRAALGMVMNNAWSQKSAFQSKADVMPVNTLNKAV